MIIFYVHILLFYIFDKLYLSSITTMIEVPLRLLYNFSRESYFQAIYCRFNPSGIIELIIFITSLYNFSLRVSHIDYLCCIYVKIISVFLVILIRLERLRNNLKIILTGIYSLLNLLSLTIFYNLKPKFLKKLTSYFQSVC